VTGKGSVKNNTQLGTINNNANKNNKCSWEVNQFLNFIK